MSTSKKGRKKKISPEQDLWLAFGWRRLKPGQPFPEDRQVALQEILAVLGKEDWLSKKKGVGSKGTQGPTKGF
jgi:hypothetical protein